MNISPSPSSCLDLTHWLPKAATAVVPILGTMIAEYAVGRLDRQVTETDDIDAKNELRDQKNYYRLCACINLIVVIAALITGVALGILAPGIGIGLSALFGVACVWYLGYIGMEVLRINGSMLPGMSDEAESVMPNGVQAVEIPDGVRLLQHFQHLQDQ